MLGAIAGDIVGSRFEKVGKRVAQRPWLPPADFDLFHPDCRFTDDTVCTVAIAAALLEDRDPAETLRAFVLRHEDRGYGGMFRRWMRDETMGPYGSWGNGAPMRTAAVGWLLDDEDAVRETAETMAAITHNHPDAIGAAQAVSLAIFWLRDGADVEEARVWVQDAFGYDLTPEAAYRPGVFDVSATGTTPAALTAAFEAFDWEEAVRTAVCLGGDTDTLACIAGSVAEAAFGLPEDIAETARNYLTRDLRDVLIRFEDVVAMSPS